MITTKKIKRQHLASRAVSSFWTDLSTKINHLKRLFGTAIGFLAFGFGGLALCATIFPLIILLSRTETQSRNRIRSVIRFVFKAFLSLLELFSVIKIHTHDLDKLRDTTGCLLICNHPTLIDVVILMAYLKNAQCIVKKELWSNVILGGVVRAAGYIRNDLDPEVFLQKCKQDLNAGENIIIFPEGTRSKPDQPLTMQRGVGNLALAALADIQAMTLDCHPVMLSKGAKWYNIAPKRVTFHLRFGKLFPLASYQSDEPRSIRVRALMRDILTYYNGYLGHD